MSARVRALAIGGALLLAQASHAQAPARSATWDVTQPRGTAREIDFTTTEGTWTSVDVSPDGSWLVFDLLGQIYRMPIGGGAAECLTQDSGIAVNVEPRISPDGRQIAFISDRRGQMNVWVMDADGRNATPVLLDESSEYRWPAWLPDGRFLIATKRPPVSFPGSNQSIVLLTRGGGTGVELLKGELGRNVSRTTVSADGRYVYYDLLTNRSTTAYGRADVLRGAVQLQRLELRTGTIRPITSGETDQGNADHPSSGGAYAAEPSPDGRWLSFIRRLPGGTLNYKGQRYGPRPALFVRDLATGAERMVMDPVEMDLAETSFPGDGSYPSYKWMPDSRGIVIHQGGKIRRLDLASGAVSTIPFSARVHRSISEQPTAGSPIHDGPVDVRFIRWASSSPDGRTIALQAVGRIWLMDRAGGTPRRLTPASFAPLEYAPTWSPDGRSIAFVSWDDERRGALWVASTDGGAPRRVTRDSGEYVNPAWATDGRSIVAMRGAGATARGQTLLRNPFFDLVRVSLDGTVEEVVQVDRSTEPYSRLGELTRPTVGTDGRLWFADVKASSPRDGTHPRDFAEVVSMRAEGTDRRVHARIANAGDLAVSPDGRWVVFSVGMNLHLAPLPPGGAAGAVPTIDRRGGELPVTTLSRDGGLDPIWRGNDVVEFSSGDRVFAHHASTGRTDTTVVHLRVPRDIAGGSIALTDARIVTLDHRRVIERGTVVVTAGRISCVGTCPTRGVDRVVSAAGKTIIPAFVDMHAHLNHEHLGILPAHNFESAVYLAYGITTTFDPSITSTDPYAAGEMADAGAMLGPRMFTSGEGITFGDDSRTGAVNSLNDALREVGRRQAWGSPMIKQYLQPTRQQRQWVLEAARQLHVLATAEGSVDLFYRISMVLDGHNGGEHMVAPTPLYSDVLTLMAKANYTYSHTPLVTGSGAWNEEYWWQASPVWQDAKLQQWIPWRELIPHTRRYVWRPETDYTKDVVAQVITDFITLGGQSALGSHGQQHGLGSHWDVWMLAKVAGPMTALEVASQHGANFLGAGKDLGSITVGKLGDLMVLNSNPLANIRNTADIRFVMKGGVLYDANSLDEIWPKAVAFGNHYWRAPEMFRIDEKPVVPPVRDSSARW